MDNLMNENMIELEKSPYLIYMMFVEDDKKTFKVFKEGQELQGVNSIAINHDDEDCFIDIDRQIGF